MAEERGEPQFVVSSVRTLDDPTWITRSTAAEDLTPQFSFSLSRSVYVGDPNSSEQIQSGKYDRPLDLPSFGTRNTLRPTAREAIGHETELAAYYRQVMALKGASPRSGDVGYWLRLDFVSAVAGKEISFPWWDRVSDATPFLSWLRRADSTDEFFDADQGWMLRAAHKGDRLHIQHSDLDTEEEFANLSVDRAAFLGRLDAAEADFRRVIAALKGKLGVDPWS
jgi:hypothetical protein